MISKEAIYKLTLMAGLGFLLNSCSDIHHAKEGYETKIIDDSLVELDLLSKGSFQFSSEEYALPATVDPVILRLPQGLPKKIKTDISGKIYLPEKQGALPFVVFLHGNHDTCGLELPEGLPRLDFALDYTTDGVCKGGLVQAPSYLGYEYVAEHLASHGYGVISINANRGITGLNTFSWGEDYFDKGLIEARGNLVLRTLENLYQWNKGNNSPLNELDLADKVDFQQVGFVGHSRGGEGVRAAYHIYKNQTYGTYWDARIPNLKIKGVFEIAPVDFGIERLGKRRTYEANGVPWNLLLAGCDKDVITYDGTQAYRRMLGFSDGNYKSIYTVWGANHNFFNSEWQVSDADQCLGNQTPLWDINAPSIASKYPDFNQGILDYYNISQAIRPDIMLGRIGQKNAKFNVTGSKAQRDIAKGTILAFFKAHLSNGRNDKFLHVFDPQYRLPTQLSKLSNVSREFIKSSQTQNVMGGNIPEVLTYQNLKVDTIAAWTKEVLTDLLQRLGTQESRVNLFMPKPRAGISLRWDSQRDKSIEIKLNEFDAEKFWTIDLIMGSRMICNSSRCPSANDPIDFSIQLIDNTGKESKTVQLSDYAEIRSVHDQFFLDSKILFGDYDYNITYIPLLMQTVRIELKDFQWRGRQENIDKIKFNITSGSRGQLSIDDINIVKFK